MRTRKTIIFAKGFGFIPDACRKCDDFVCDEPCACEHDCERVDFYEI